MRAEKRGIFAHALCTKAQLQSFEQMQAQEQLSRGEMLRWLLREEARRRGLWPLAESEGQQARQSAA